MACKRPAAGSADLDSEESLKEAEDDWAEDYEEEGMTIPDDVGGNERRNHITAIRTLC